MENKVGRTIAFIHYQFPYGGAETVTSHISAYLISKGYNVTIFATSVNEKKLMDNHAKVNFVILPDVNINSKTNADFILSEINKRKIEFFIIPIFGFNPPVYIRSKCNCKFVFLFHNMPSWEYEYKMGYGRDMRGKSILKKLEWYLFRSVKYKLTLKKKIAKKYRAMYDAVDVYAILCDDYGVEMAKMIGDNLKIRTLLNPTLQPQELINLTKQKQILYTGRLSYADKRVDRLLDIWNLLYDKFPDWELLIVGTGDEELNLKEYAKQLGLKNYRFCGYTSNVNRFLQDASILCLTSTYEGWGLSMTEAQSYGVIPCAYDCCAGVRVILLPNGVNGVLVDCFDKKEYARRLAELMSNDSLRSEMQKNVIERVKEFRLENVGKRWEDMFDELSYQRETSSKKQDKL